MISAATAARRSRLAELVRRNVERASIVCVSRLSLDHSGDALPDLWLADLETPAAGASLLQALEDSPQHLGIVTLIDDPDLQLIRAALDAGIHAIITRDPDGEELRLALEAADAGLVLLHPSSAERLSSLAFSSPESAAAEAEPLTPREKQVLRLIGEGLGNKQIATRLEISEHTAKFHISSILGKLHVGSRAEAVSQGIRRGLIPI